MCTKYYSRHCKTKMSGLSFRAVKLSRPDKYLVERIKEGEFFVPKWDTDNPDNFYLQLSCNFSLVNSLFSLIYNAPYLLGDKVETTKDIVSLYSSIQLSDEHLLYNYNEISTPVYAIVMFYNDKYEGHLYSWILPDNPSRCLFFEPRTRVDYTLNPTMSNPEYHLISSAVSVLDSSVKSIGIIDPKSYLQDLLRHLGFRVEYIKGLKDTLVDKDTTLPLYTINI